MAEPALGALRAAVEALRAQAPGRERSVLRAEIAALRARLQQAGAELAELAASLEALDPGTDAPTAVPGARAAAAPIRADHLGASTYRDRGWSLIAAGDRPGAIEALRTALRLAPEDAEAEVMLGWALMLDDRLDEALAAFGRVLAREPGHPMARVNLGYICLRRRIFGEAIEHLTMVLRGTSDRKATLYANYYLGLVYMERGMFGDALPFLRQALTLGPNLHEAAYDLGRALWFAGETGPARETWRQAASTGRDSPWAVRCAEVLSLAEAGGEVPRSRPR